MSADEKKPIKRECMSSNGLKRYSPSSAGFANKDGIAVTQYNSGCYRSILVSQFVRTSFPELYGVVGDHDEVRFAEILEDRGDNFDREVVIKNPGVREVGYSGRSDFILYDDKGVTKVIEKKSVTSPNTRLSVIRKGVPKINNLGQLISYMVQLHVTKGALRYDYYQKEWVLGPDDSKKELEKLPDNELLNLGKIKLVQTEEKEFEIEITSEGKILVDGEAYPFSAPDQLRHQLITMRHLRDETVGDRPFGSEDPFNSPCKFCKMSNTCDRYDSRTLEDQEFIDEAIKEVKLRDSLDNREPKIQLFRKRRK